jgi:hypothetical protein
MKLAIMQPYLFPYIGYFQIINAVDEFILYDNIEYTKKGWINRNRILLNNTDSLISFPLRKDSDFLFIKDRTLSDSWDTERVKLLNRIRESYRKAPFFEPAFNVVSRAILCEERNLFAFILYSLEQIKKYLRITTPLTISSTVPINHELRSEEKVIALCQARQASTYINPIGGVELYDKIRFSESGISLQFLKTEGVEYMQFGAPFVPHLSIIDVMMFNSVDAIGQLLNRNYTLN